ncbi:uncharacterized protein LOC134260368 [Saccostrea cucullata]|uniref:uncharacterized protein LOC134260368 n=1 Tax=Saccostrea cuccullata TaxID=36930 RepID=UPI002ED11B3D
MTKWKHVVEWFLKSLILHYGCSAYNINSEVCLQKLFDFAWGDKGCNFTLADAKQWLETDTTLCPRKCRVKINNLDETKRVFDTKYRLEFIHLRFNVLVENSMRMKRKCIFLDPSKDGRTMEINCKINAENLVDSPKDLCTSSHNCTEESKKCFLTGKIGICVCKPEYIGFENQCLKGNLKLNDTCQRNEQCSVVSGLVCQNDTCVRGRGYVPLNDSECFPSRSGGSLQANTREQEKDNAASVTVGAVIGGLILGIVLTIAVGTIHQHLRYGKFKTKECSRTAVFNNATYETETDMLQNNATQRKVVNVPPLAHSDELHENGDPEGGLKSSMENNDVNNDVYNHLHEKEENLEVDENYDHAHGNINHSMEESDYSDLNTGKNHERSNVFSSEDNDYDDQDQVDDYCSLKQ